MAGHRPPCGHRLEAHDRDAPFMAAREHMDRDRPDFEHVL
jgi:hypothetical protein